MMRTPEAASVVKTSSRAVGKPAILVLASVLALSLQAGMAMAADTARVQLVIDGSGSMWGKMTGDAGPKFAIVRDALRQNLPRLARTTEVGLALFGHRRRGDCSDVELAVIPQPLDAGRLVAPLDKLNPKGRGPLALALVSVADASPNTLGKDSIILVHDDLDNCQGDPCAVARDLKRIRPQLAIHVVSLGMRQEDVEQMRCVPQITGGRMFDVQDAPSAISAIGEALHLASLQGPTPVAQPTGKASPKAPEPETGPPGLRLSASLAPGSAPLKQPVQFRVFRQNEDAGDPLADVAEAEPSLALEPGIYIVEARLGNATARQNVEVVGDRPTRVSIALNAGAIKLQAAHHDASGQPSAMVISLEEHKAGDVGRGRVLWVGRAQDRELIVPVGSYRLITQDRQFRSEKIIAVEAGSRSAPQIMAATGRIRLQVRDSFGGGAASEAVLFRVLEDDPNAPAGRREVARSVATEPVFTLSAGTYHLVAGRGAAEVRELIALKGGDDVVRALTLKLGQLSLSTRLPGAAATPQQDVSYRVVRLDADGQVVARVAQAQASLQLPAGRYRVEAKVGGLNALVSRDVDLREGVQQDIALEPSATSVHLRLTGPGGGLNAADVFWDVLDSSGRSVWRSMEGEPHGVLAAGHYIVRAETRGRRLEKAVDLRPGEQRTLELAVE